MPATTAYQEFADAFGYQLGSRATVLEFKGGKTSKTVLSPSGLASGEVVADLQYVPTPTGPQLAWKLNVPLLNSGRWLDASIGTSNGNLLHYADSVWNATYNVYSLPTENPEDGLRSYAVNPQDPVASPFGWHDVNGLPGPDFFDTRGNNADAVLDRNGDFLTTGNVPPGGGGWGPNLSFDFPVNLTQQPSTYSNAAVTNLFYWANVSHDIHYRYGFTEAAGNFQTNNYGRGGLGGDAVLALAQVDANNAAGNNAFFGWSHPMGYSPRLRCSSLIRTYRISRSIRRPWEAFMRRAATRILRRASSCTSTATAFRRG